MTEIEKLGKEIETIFQEMDLFCILKKCTDNEIATSYEFNLKNLKDFPKLSKAIKILKICYHKNITMEESSTYHFKVKVPKDNNILSTTNYEDFASKQRLSVLLGLDEAGEKVEFNLRRAIHTLIAGATGMGKTNLINNIIYSLANKNTDKQIKLYLIDIKKTLSIWNNLPQVEDVAKTPTDACELLEEISHIIDKRFEKLEKMQKTKADEETFPYIVVVIDELADLMLSGLKKYIEQEIAHIAQIGRAVNVSLIIATQSPIAKVCTNLIKANCPTIIALKTVSIPTSRVILDNKGAFELSGIGDCIIRNADYPCEKNFKSLFLQEDKILKYIKGVEKCSTYSRRKAKLKPPITIV